MLRHTRYCLRCFSRNIVPPVKFNPLRRKGKRILDQTLSENRVCVTILGNGSYGQPRCVGLFTDFRGYLFNCGEGVGRICKEYDICMWKIRHIFITQKQWHNMSGISDIYLTNEAHGITRMSLYGPPGIELFTSMISSERFGINIVRQPHYVNDILEITPIVVEKSSKTRAISIDGLSYNYVCKLPQFNGELNLETCIEQSVPVGPLLLKLKEGEDVCLSSGKMVYAADVLQFAQSTTILLIVDCPSKDFLHSFVNECQFSAYQNPSSSVYAIFHFSPSDVVRTQKYQQWMQRFHSGTLHFMLNSSEPSMSDDAFCQTTQRVLSQLHPEIFKVLPIKNKASPESSDVRIIEPPVMSMIHLRPAKKILWNNVSNTCIPENVDMFRNISEYNRELAKLHSTKTSLFPNRGVLPYPEVLFLGTGSATCTPFRNVSSILVNTNSKLSILLDCGEGSFGQLVRYYGSTQTKAVLQKLACIFVTHKHIDHYLGIFEFIKARAKAFKDSGMPYKQLAVVLPFQIGKIFYRFYDVFESLRPYIKIYYCNFLTAENRSNEILDKFLGDIKLETVLVRHCEDAYGCVLQLNSEWKIVYSGDTAPCQKLIDAGMNCSLLIHEASMESNLLTEATMKKHSTPAQVIELSEKMNAEFTIMTHFSKRYLAVPPVFTDDLHRFGCAFDFMKVRLDELHLIPLFTPALKRLFQEHYESNLEKSSTVASTENIFLKTYRSVKT